MELIICYVVGTATGVWLSRSYWMASGASRLYDLLESKGLLKRQGGGESVQ